MAKHTQVGSGAPTTTPTELNQHYLDQVSGKLYLSNGTSSSADWKDTTPVTPRSNFVGVGASGVGLLDSSSVMPTAPTLNTIVGAGLTGAVTVQTNMVGFIDLEGSIILPPGAYVATYTSTISGAAGSSFSFTWEEIPI
jgi:hypothetical protein